MIFDAIVTGNSRHPYGVVSIEMGSCSPAIAFSDS